MSSLSPSVLFITPQSCILFYFCFPRRNVMLKSSHIKSGFVFWDLQIWRTSNHHAPFLRQRFWQLISFTAPCLISTAVYRCLSLRLSGDLAHEIPQNSYITREAPVIIALFPETEKWYSEFLTSSIWTKNIHQTCFKSCIGTCPVLRLKESIQHPRSWFLRPNTAETPAGGVLVSAIVLTLS